MTGKIPANVSRTFWLFCSFALLQSLAVHADEARVSELEARLLDADRVQLQFSVTASGAVAASLSGFMIIQGDREVALDASGHFAGQEVELKLATMGNELHFGHKSSPTSSAIPPQLKPALVIGFVRMGILHNLARLVAGAAPDHADGGVTDWVILGDYSEGSDDATAFSIQVAGQEAGSARLEFAEGRLVRREQTVDFPGGSMSVVEEYDALQLR